MADYVAIDVLAVHHPPMPAPGLPFLLKELTLTTGVYYDARRDGDTESDG